MSRYIDDFWDLVDIRDVGECWPWKGGHSGGYGSYKGRGPCSHRVAFELFYDRKPKGVVDHKVCSNRGCQNPLHMVEERRGINATRERSEASKARTHCVNGHEFTEKNTYVRTNGNRVCRKCRAEGMASKAIIR